jgi:hypothetical protein
MAMLADSPVETRSSDPISRNEVLLLAVATLGVVVLGIVLLGNRQFWADESFTYRASQLPVGDLWRWATSAAGELNMVLYYALVGPLSRAHSSDLVMRLPSVAATIATVPLVWLIADRLGRSRFVRVAAVLLFLTQPLVVDFAFETRAYAILTVSVAGLTLLLMVALAGSRRCAVAYALLLPLIIGLQFVGIFVLIAHGLAILVFVPGSVFDRVWRAVRLTGLGAAVALAALVVFGTQDTLERRKPFEVSTIVRTTYNLTGRAGPLSIVIAVALVAGLLALWKRRREGPDGAIVALTMLVPLALAMVLSVSRPMFTAHYLLDVVPIIACISALGLAALTGDRRHRIGLLALVVVFGLLGQAAIFRTPDREQPDSATRVVLREAGPEDQIAFESAAAIRTYEHYLDSRRLIGPAVVGQPQTVGRGVEPDDLMPESSLDQLTASVSELPAGSSLWLVVSRADTERLDAIERALSQAGLHRSDSWSSSRVGLQRWQRAP